MLVLRSRYFNVTFALKRSGTAHPALTYKETVVDEIQIPTARIEVYVGAIQIMSVAFFEVGGSKYHVLAATEDEDDLRVGAKLCGHVARSVGQNDWSRVDVEPDGDSPIPF